MIPILYDKTETSFSSNGLGRLSDCIRCKVTEERNGKYECEFEYPVNGKNFDEIQIGRVIACTHDDYGDVQPFDIYAKSEPLNGIVTFNAHHISYRLNEITVKPFEAGTVALALQHIKNYSVTTNPFTFWTDRSSSAQFVNDVPRKARNMLGGEENSILDVFGTGEYEFDKFTVRLYAQRGQDTNISIRYAKNLTNFENDYDIQDSYTAVVPFWKGQDDQSAEVLITLSEWFILSGHTVDSGRVVCVPMDLSTEFDTPPTQSELRTKAQSRLSASESWNPNQTVKINFVQLWQTEEYRDYAPLQRVRLCDTVGVFVPMYNMSLRAKVISVTYNVLLNRYDSMTLGDKPTTYAHVIEKQYDSKVAGIEEGFNSINASINSLTQDVNTKTAIFYGSPSGTYSNVNTGDYLVDNSTGSTYRWSGSAWVVQTDYQTAIANATATIQDDIDDAVENATDLIRGGTGGYIITTANANGQPIELLITDNLDINQAQDVWRWNQGGLAHSSNGYNGPFNDVAILQDGSINASLITTGTLIANLIKAGVLSDANGYNYWDLDNGELHITVGGNSNYRGALTAYNASGTLTGEWNNNGIDLISATTYISGYKRGITIENGGQITLYKLKTSNNQKTKTGFIHSASAYVDRPIFRGVPSVSIGGTTNEDGSGYTSYITVGVDSSNKAYARLPPNTICSGYFSADGVSLFSDGSNLYMGLGSSSGGLTSGIRIRKSGTNDVYVMGGSLYVGSTHYKSKISDTDNYGQKLLFCYEMSEPIYGDIGEGITDENGICVVSIDDLFNESIEKNIEYYVFLQKEGEGDVWIDKKMYNYFVVKGTPNLKFAWEIKAKQKGFASDRFEDIPSEIYSPLYDLSNTEEIEELFINELDDLIKEQEAVLL